MALYYTNVEIIGDNVCERYIEDGVEKMRKVPFQPTLYHHTQHLSDLSDIYGKPVVPKSFGSIHESRNWMKRMKDMGQEVCGMDDYALQYLHENYHGPVSYNMGELRIAYIDIEVFSQDGFPYPEIARWEIDSITHYDSIEDKYFVFSTREWWREKSTLDKHIVDRIEYKMFKDERDMMIAYVSFWRDHIPTIITGWFSESFDIPYIVNRMKVLWGESAPNKLSPWGKIKARTVKVKNKDGIVIKENIVYDILGIACLDYLLLYKKFTFKTRPNYKLGYIAKVELDTTKLEYEGTLSTLALDNPQLYVDYNIYDVDIICQLDKSLLLFELVTSLGYYSHMNFDSVMSPLRTWDAIIYNSLMEQNIVVPENKQQSKSKYEGAYVKDPVPGLYNYLLSFDLESLYPRLIMQYNISPETIRGQFARPPLTEFISKQYDFGNQQYSCCANGMMYAKDQRGIIPIEIEKVFRQRKAAKKNEFAANALYTKSKTVVNARGGDISQDYSNMGIINVEQFFGMEEEELAEMTDAQLSLIIHIATGKEKSYNVEQLARKVLINSLYGALGNRFFRYYDLRNAEAITLSGQLSIRWIERKLNEYFNTMCSTDTFDYTTYIDTDSVYLCVENFVDMMCERSGKTREEIGTVKIVDMLDKFAKTKVEPYIGECYDELKNYMNAYEQGMFMDREVIADKGFWTGKKRYALNVWDAEGKRKYDKQGNLQSKLKIMGIETQRSSTPIFVQKALEESIRIILQENEENLQTYYAEVEDDYNKRDYREIASVSSANNIMKDCTPEYYPIKGCRGHIKGVLAYNRMATKTRGVDVIQDGEKVALLTLKEPNPLGCPIFAYPSGGSVPTEFGIDIEKSINYLEMIKKTYTSPLITITQAISWDYEKRQTLDFLFG